MSSILKALKKLESQPAAKVEVKSGSQTLDTSKVVQTSSSSKRDGKIMFFVYCVLFAGIIITFGYLFLQNQGKNLESDYVETSTRLEQDIIITQPDSVKLEESKVLQQGVQQEELQRETYRQEQQTSMASQREPLIKGKKLQVESVTKPLNSVKISDKIKLNTETTENLLAIENADSELVETKKVVSTTKAEQIDELRYPRLDYSVLELQAITWAEDPQGRFALVENRILRTGESIKGYIIDSIHEGYVVVSQGYDKWRVEFRLR